MMKLQLCKYCSVQAQDGSAASPMLSLAATSPRRSTLGRATTAAERTLSMSATLRMATMPMARSSQDRESDADAENPSSPTTATMRRSGESCDQAVFMYVLPSWLIPCIHTYKQHVPLCATTCHQLCNHVQLCVTMSNSMYQKTAGQHGCVPTM